MRIRSPTAQAVYYYAIYRERTIIHYGADHILCAGTLD